jgi:hypothetical protein
METNNKYYTPELTEFHYGFDYELKDDNGDWLWSNVIQDTKLLSKCIADKRCRVKHLDKEDIESVGFKTCFKDETETVFDINNFEYLLHLIGDHIIIKYVIYDDGTRKETETKFDGKIKNRSELKKILNQIEII